MTIREISLICKQKPKRDGSLDMGLPLYDLFVANEGGAGGYDNLEMLDRDDLELLRDMLNEIIRVDDSLGKGGER